MLQDERGFSYTLLAQDAQDADVLVDGIVLLPEEDHRGEFQELVELVVKCSHDVLPYLFGTNIRKLQKSSRKILKKLRDFSRNSIISSRSQPAVFSGLFRY